MNSTEPGEWTNGSVVTDASSSSGSAQATIDPVTVLRYCTIVIGVTGMTLNGFVLSALFSKNLRKNNTNILITNQCSIDLYSSVMLILTASIKVPKPYYRAPWGTGICLTFGNEMLIW